MGTYGEPFYHNGLTPKQFHSKRYNHETDEAQYRVLADAWINFSEYYAAVEIRNKRTGGVQVYGAMDLLYVRREGYGTTLYHKPIGEDMGPYYYNCPAKILDLLTPTENKQANEWRKKCREVIAEREAKAELCRNLKPGDRVSFKGRTWGGISDWVVSSVGPRGKVRFSASHYGGVPLTGWKNYVAAVNP